MRLSNWRDPQVRRDLLIMGSWKDPAIRRALLTIAMSAAFVGMVALFMAGVPFTNPSYCGRLCHATSPDYQTWAKSTHAGVSCHFCHEDSSYVGISGDRFTKPVDRLIKAQHDRAPINADSAYSQKQARNDWCQRCHAAVVKTAYNKKGLSIKATMHAKHLGAGLSCTTCHNRIAHLGAEKYVSAKTKPAGFKYKNYMTMREGCWRCHSRDQKYRDPAAVALIGSKSAPTECAVCHNPNSDLKPTTGRLNHNVANGIPWKDGKQRHGKIAVADFDACLACHEREPRAGIANTIPNCSTSCHNGVAMPHNIPAWAKYFKSKDETPVWLKDHPIAAAGGGVNGDARMTDPGGVCTICHDRDRVSANFCQSCHHKDFIASQPHSQETWRGQHSNIVKENGSGDCNSCHQLEFCAYCHLSGKKALRASL